MATDDFNRANGSLGSNWTNIHPTGLGGVISGNAAIGATTGSYCGSAYTGATFTADQSAQITRANASQYCAPAVRMFVSGGANWYCYFNDATFQRFASNNVTTLGTFGTFASGQTAKIAVAGTLLEFFVAGVSQGTQTDAGLSTGTPGIAFFSNISTVDDWIGTGDAVPTLTYLTADNTAGSWTPNTGTTLFAPLGVSSIFPTPTAYWPLNEASGTTLADATGNGHTGTVVGGAWDTTTKKFGAAALTGATGSGRLASFTPINLLKAHTIACWINGWDGTTAAVLLGGAASYYVYLDSTTIYYSTPGDATSKAHGGFTGQHHLAVTRSAGVVRFYKDGVDLGAPAFNLADTNNFTIGSIGGYDDGTFRWPASIDDVRLYTVAMTAAEIATLAALDPAANVVDSDYIRANAGAASDVAKIAFGTLATPGAGTVSLVVRHRIGT